MKTARIHFRTTEDERNQLIALMPSLSLSEVVRQAIKKFVQTQDSKKEPHEV